jgi:hypothetical protein
VSRGSEGIGTSLLDAVGSAVQPECDVTSRPVMCPTTVRASAVSRSISDVLVAVADDAHRRVSTTMRFERKHTKMSHLCVVSRATIFCRALNLCRPLLCSRLDAQGKMLIRAANRRWHACLRQQERMSGVSPLGEACPRRNLKVDAERFNRASTWSAVTGEEKQ